MSLDGLLIRRGDQGKEQGVGMNLQPGTTPTLRGLPLATIHGASPSSSISIRAIGSHTSFTAWVGKRWDLLMFLFAYHND